MAEPKDGTAPAEVKAGEQSTEQKPNNEQEAAEPTATETATEQAGTLTEADLEEARKMSDEKPSPAPVDAEEDEVIKKIDPKTQEHINKKIGKLTGRAKTAEERNSELQKENQRLREEAAYLKGRAETYEKGGLSPSAAKEAAQRDLDQGKSSVTDNPRPVRPKMKDFDNEDDYGKALDKFDDDLSKWNREQWSRETETKTQAQRDSEARKAQEKAAAEAERRSAEEQNLILSKVEEEYGKEAVESILNSAAEKRVWFTQAMREATFSGEAPHKTLVFLERHKDIASRIAGIPNPELQRREIYRLEGAINNKTPRTSKAPEPITKVEGAAEIDNDSRYASENISTDERIEMSRKRRGLKT